MDKDRESFGRRVPASHLPIAPQVTAALSLISVKGNKPSPELSDVLRSPQPHSSLSDRPSPPGSRQTKFQHG